MNALPATMKALLLEGPAQISVKELPLPKPADGEVLIKVMAAPINPSDIYFIKSGAYSGVKTTPCVAGFEGSGVVVASGGGLIGWGLVNKKVAFTPTPQSGTYGQYALAKSSECLPVDDSMSFEHASMSFVNPLTAMAMLDIAKSTNTKAVIVNAAASSLGRMLNRFLPAEGVEIINIVRKEEQMELLKKEGANFILNSEHPDFEERLAEMAAKMRATICYDAIGGTISSRILKNMPKRSALHIYGLLSGENIGNIDAGDMIYSGKTITGLFLPNWLEEKGTLKLLPAMLKLRKLLLRELKSEIALETSLEDFEESLKQYMSNMTKGKVVVKPYSEPKLKEEKLEEKEKEENKPAE